MFLSKIFFGESRIPEEKEKMPVPVLPDEVAKNFPPLLTASDEKESLIRMMASNEKTILSNWQENLREALVPDILDKIGEEKIAAQTLHFFKCFLKEFSDNNEKTGFSSSAESIRTVSRCYAELGLLPGEASGFVSSFRDTIFIFIPEMWEPVPREIVSEMIRINQMTARLEVILTETFLKARESRILAPVILGSETLSCGSDLIVNFVQGLNIIEQRIEKDTMSVIRALQEIVHKSREGSEQANAVLSHFLGKSDVADKQTGNSYAARVIQENEAVLKKADSVFQTLDQINRHVSESLNTIVGKVKEIHRIVEDMDEIASQSKILAMNAAIEASRAGEKGKRFSVVANEMKNLADISARSAANISDSAAESMNLITLLKYKIDTQIAAGNSEMENAEKNFRTAYKQFKDFTDNISEAIRTLTLRYQAIAEDIENATVALQFQDMISQEISEINASMMNFRSQIEDICNIWKSSETLCNTEAALPHQTVLTGESTMPYTPRVREKKGDDVEFF